MNSMVNRCAGGGRLDVSIIAGTGSSSASVNINKKVLVITGSHSHWNGSTIGITINIEGQYISCTNENGTLMVVNQQGVSPGRHLKLVTWVNNKIYKNKIIMNAYCSGTVHDSASAIEAVVYN